VVGRKTSIALHDDLAERAFEYLHAHDAVLGRHILLRDHHLRQGKTALVVVGFDLLRDLAQFRQAHLAPHSGQHGAQLRIGKLGVAVQLDLADEHRRGVVTAQFGRLFLIHRNFRRCFASGFFRLAQAFSLFARRRSHLGRCLIHSYDRARKCKQQNVSQLHGQTTLRDSGR